MTTGYTRQVAEISTIGASGGSPNSAGNGVQVDSIRRVSNQYQVNQVWYAASDYGYYSTQQGYLSQLEAVLSDDNSSLSGGFDNFFAALNEATTSPDDSALREQVISEAGALSLRIDKHAGLHRLAKHGNHQPAAGDGVANQYAHQRHRQL